MTTRPRRRVPKANLAFSVKGPRCRRFAPLFLKRMRPKTRKVTLTCDGQQTRCILVRGPALGPRSSLLIPLDLYS